VYLLVDAFRAAGISSRYQQQVALNPCNPSQEHNVAAPAAEQTSTATWSQVDRIAAVAKNEYRRCACA
jgi:hypothetical protein